MIHGYHVIWGAYGFWLPNDPRGSWSDFVYSWELARFGCATKSMERRDVEPQEYARWRRAARQALLYPPVRFTERQIHEVGEAFGRFVRKSRVGVWACSILSEHVHLVLARHRYRIEQVAKLLKGEATRGLLNAGVHPFHATQHGAPRSPWAEGCWKVYLDSVDAIEIAIRYVEDNPGREGRTRQDWDFVTPLTGIDSNASVTYH